MSDVVARIRNVRGQRVLLDSDLAALYGLATKALNQAVQRNLRRFPPDFVLELSMEEWTSLRSQTGEGLRNFVERMAIADHVWPQPDQSRGPEQHGVGI